MLYISKTQLRNRNLSPLWPKLLDHFYFYPLLFAFSKITQLVFVFVVFFCTRSAVDVELTRFYRLRRSLPIEALDGGKPFLTEEYCDNLAAILSKLTPVFSGSASIKAFTWCSLGFFFANKVLLKVC